jgi:hypothetical protein
MSIGGNGRTLVYEVGLPGVHADSLSLLSDHTDGPSNVPTKLKWSFDGHRITYLLDHKLWAVSVPDNAGIADITTPKDGQKPAETKKQ